MGHQIVCRLCLQHNDVEVPVIQNQDLEETISDLLSIRIIKTDAEDTNKICLACNKYLEEFLSYKQKCIFNQKMFFKNSLKEEVIDNYENEEILDNFENEDDDICDSGSGKENKKNIYLDESHDDKNNIDIFKNSIDIFPDIDFYNESFAKDDKNADPSYSSRKRKTIKKKKKIKKVLPKQLFQCLECDFSTEREAGVKRHMERKHLKTEDLYECPNCEKKFNEKSYVKTHLKVCTEKSVTYIKKSSSFSLPLIEGHLKRVLADDEKEEFSKLVEGGRDMDIYIKIWGHWNFPRNWECATCSHQMTGKLAVYDEHYQEAHGIRPIYKCEICSEIIEGGGYCRYKGRGKFIDHLKTHLLEYLCTAPQFPSCPFSSPSKVELKQHMEKVHQVKTGNMCEECGKTFKSVTILNKHIRDQHKDQLSVVCTICGKTFPRAANLKMHIKLQHEESKSWPCEICGKEMSSKNILVNHVKIHSLERKEYVCDYPNCGRSFMSTNGVNCHKRTDHSDVKEHVCQVCGNEYKLIRQLKQHLLTHQTDTPFNCEHCGKGFKVMSRLKEHINIHTGKMPYECGYCGRRIRSQPNLFHHLKHHRAQNHPLHREKEYFKVE